MIITVLFSCIFLDLDEANLTVTMSRNFRIVAGDKCVEKYYGQRTKMSENDNNWPLLYLLFLTLGTRDRFWVFKSLKLVIKHCDSQVSHFRPLKFVVIM